MKTSTKAVLIGLGVIVAFLALLAGLWTGDRRPPVIFDNATTRIIGGSFSPGGEAAMEYRTTRLRDCPVKIDRVFDDAQGIRHQLPDYDFPTTQPLGAHTVRRAIQIPTGASDGLGFYRSITTYYCNPVQMLWPLRGPSLDVGVTVKR